MQLEEITWFHSFRNFKLICNLYKRLFELSKSLNTLSDSRNSKRRLYKLHINLKFLNEWNHVVSSNCINITYQLIQITLQYASRKTFSERKHKKDHWGEDLLIGKYISMKMVFRGLPQGKWFSEGCHKENAF